MTDIEKAVSCLPGHTLALCKNGEVILSDKRGVAPMADFLQEGCVLEGWSAADRIVGRAAAMLFIKAGVCAVHAQTLSVGGKELLEKHGVIVSWGQLTQQIINRDKTGPCPMEAAVAGLEVEAGCRAIFNTLAKMRAHRG